MQNINNQLIRSTELEEQLCNFTIEYTSIQLQNLIKKAIEDEKDFYENLVTDLKEITFAYNFIDEVEELEVDFPLHNKKHDLVEFLNKIKTSKNLNQKEYYLGQIYNTYSNYCDKCGNVYDYLNHEDLKKYLLNRILDFNNIENSSIISKEMKLVIDIWVCTLTNFDPNNKDMIFDEFKEKLASL